MKVEVIILITAIVNLAAAIINCLRNKRGEVIVVTVILVIQEKV